ncbi:phosphonate O-methyltransferase DhpI [Streptomyces sp. NRRL S-118]|uniref:phosphonate O-methyltransferase DhpI n=1 Tax=Streptomyces sp. NRRL S-118 TaxID=1463881 RepID=UPI000587956F|nr:phosphonate O-methyltransferase DhpI [Streptomyces sp. NRRL S-118]
MTTSHGLIESQLSYYRARASEYDTTFVPYMDSAAPAALERLRAGNIRGDVLELASGTGYWTRHLSGLADRVTALDGSAEMIAEAGRHGLDNVEFRQQDLFDWTPDRQWDAVFFAHWLAHVPDDRFDAFWASVRSAVAPDGVVEFVDVTDHERRLEERDDSEPEVAVRRTLQDGRSFRIVKVFRSPAELTERLTALGWSCSVDEVHPGFLYATCRPVRR